VPHSPGRLHLQRLLELLAQSRYIYCSLCSLRCSLGCRRLRRIWPNGKALFGHLLLQIGGANIENPPTLSSLAEEKAPPLARSAWLAPLAEAGAR
jgi:hypothetical protein